MSKSIKWFGSFRKEKSLKEKILYKICLYREQITNVNKLKNQMLANGIPEDKIMLLDAPEKMLIFTNVDPILLKKDFIIALYLFIDDIDRSQIIKTEEYWQYDIFRCKIGNKKIYCDIS